MKRFLFIGHDAGRTGAPIVLLHYLRWVRTNRPEWECDLLLLRGGELEDEYRAVADVFKLRPEPARTIVRRGAKYVRDRLGLGIKAKTPPLALFSRQYDAVLANTVVSLEQLEFFKRKNIRTLCWMHELEYIVRSFFTPERFREAAHFVDEFIVPTLVLDEFLKAEGIDRPRHLVHDFTYTGPSTATVEGLDRRSLEIPADAFVILGCGTVEWRKGVDLFVQIAARLIPKYPDLYFVWVGGPVGGDTMEYERVMFDRSRLEVGPRLIFPGFVTPMQSLYAACDVFALTSREDPFPLVCLEAAKLEKPTICFEKAGGMPEFVEDDAGAVVPYADVDAFCDAVVRFRNDRQLLRAAGKAAAEKAGTRFSAEVSCEKISRILSGDNIPNN